MLKIFWFHEESGKVLMNFFHDLKLGISKKSVKKFELSIVEKTQLCVLTCDWLYKISTDNS